MVCNEQCLKLFGLDQAKQQTPITKGKELAAPKPAFGLPKIIIIELALFWVVCGVTNDRFDRLMELESKSTRVRFSLASIKNTWLWEPCREWFLLHLFWISEDFLVNLIYWCSTPYRPRACVCLGKLLTILTPSKRAWPNFWLHFGT